MSSPALQPASGPSSSSSTKTRPLLVSGRYDNPWPTWHKNSLLSILKMMLSRGQTPDPLTGTDIAAELPIHTPAWSTSDSSVTYTWLGHASALVQLYGVNVLLDPVFSERCGPTSWIGPKRLRPTPCTIEQLPPIDVVLISHNHYDHLSAATPAPPARLSPHASSHVCSALRSLLCPQ